MSQIELSLDDVEKTMKFVATAAPMLEKMAGVANGYRDDVPRMVDLAIDRGLVLPSDRERLIQAGLDGGLEKAAEFVELLVRQATPKMGAGVEKAAADTKPQLAYDFWASQYGG
jgi:hypothetical protein